jgi:CO/xanthine dehydrogenase Mo-binding subunit
VGFWRSVGHSINGFVIESFIDELAHIAEEDPYLFRKAHLKQGDRRMGVLDRVAQVSGWGKALPQGVFEGIAVHKSFDSYVAEVCRVSVSGSEIKIHEVFCVVDCGRVIHPENVKAQIESGVVYGLSAALYGEVDFADGSVVQGNFNDYPVLRHDACPVMVTEILESTAEPTGVGEPGTPPIAAALCNALFKATGKRIRTLPLSRTL